jgi:hypothetical protein
MELECRLHKQQAVEVGTMKDALVAHASQQLTIVVINNGPPLNHHPNADTFGSSFKDINDNQINHEGAST